MTSRDEKEVLAMLKRAHKMSISGPGVADDATTYGMAAVALEKAYQERDEALEDLRDKKSDAREADESRSWARLVPESYLYPDEFQLQGTTTGAGMQARLDGNRIYARNFDGLLQPIPGEVYLHVRTGRYFLVLATAEHRHHAVMDVVDYTGPMPTPEKS